MENSISRLVRGIEYHANMKKEDVAPSVGYSRQHLDREIKSGKEGKVYKALKEKYPLISRIVANELTGKANSYSLLSDDPTISEVKSALITVIAALDKIEKNANSGEIDSVSESGFGLKKPSGK